MTILSPFNQQYIKNQSVQKETYIPQTQKETVISKEQKLQFKKIDKKLACSFGAALGVAALAGIIIHKVKSAKAGDVVNKAQKAVENIKQFFDKDNNLKDSVTLQKGRAINADGTPFSGIMNTINKNGKKIAIEYQDGDIINSSIDGKLFKKYENIEKTLGNTTEKLPRTQGVHVTCYDNNGSIKSQKYIQLR